MEFRVEIGEIREIQSVTTLTSVIVTLTHSGGRRLNLFSESILKCRPWSSLQASYRFPWAGSKLKPSCVVFV